MERPARCILATALEHFVHVLQLEGILIALNYHDAQVTYVAMGTDSIADVAGGKPVVRRLVADGRRHGDERDHPRAAATFSVALAGTRTSRARYRYNVANCSTFVT